MESYDLRLTGHPLPGHDRSSAARELARVMRLAEAQAAGLLSGRETLIKRGLTDGQLPAYLKALEQAGVGVRIDPPLPAPPRAERPSPPPAATTMAAAANPFQAPTARVDDVFSDENNSGGGSGTVPPPGVKGWSWGAFLLNWIWAVFNKTWIGLLCLVPYVGFLMSIYLGIKGRELAWRNKRWESIEHFNRVQRRWSAWGLVLVFGVAGIGILAAIAIPAYVDYARAAGGR